MNFSESRINGVRVIDRTPHEDDRGWFARSWCRREFCEAGMDVEFVQSNLCFNLSRGTLRGMHYQASPGEEGKLVAVAAGAIYDVVLDLRPDSPTFREWQAFELSLKNDRMLFIPKGVAHGYQTLVDQTTVVYQMTEYFAPEHGRVARWDDPAFGIEWPIYPPTLISEKDRCATLQ